jgi:hypothetical protein
VFEPGPGLYRSEVSPDFRSPDPQFGEALTFSHMPRQFTAAANKREGHTHVLLIMTGSVASVKAPLIVDELLKVGKKKTVNSCRASVMTPARFLLVQGRLGAGGRDQAVAHVLPTRGHQQTGSERLDG